MSDNKDTEKKQTVNKPSSPVPSQNDNELDDKTKEKLQVAVRAPRHVQRHNAKLIESQQKGFLNFSPMEKRIAIGAGRIGINIADGLLFSTHKVLGPVVTAGFAVYGLSNIFYNYHTGALNRLGYRMTKTDLALSVGKEVVTSVTGLAIGAAVGTLIGMSGIPVIGQLVLGTVLSVGLGLVVGTLITRYADRLFIRLQIRHRYNYPRGRRGARRRFEEILAQYEDLNVLEVSRVVQHYADYRVASGWESPNDIDYYRNADGDPRFMPVSFQHFAIVQLERRWGFLRNRTSCRRVFKALMLTHHPDRGGDTALAAQLKTDYEIYAFCCGWMGDCATLLSAEVPNENPEVHEQYDARTHRKRNAVKEFFRSLFRPATNSAMDAEDLHRFGLLSIDNKSRQTLETVEAIQNMEEGEDEELEHTLGTDGNSDEDEDYRTDSSVRRHMQVNNRLVQQASIFRVLGAIHQTYQNTAEVVTFSSLVRIYENAAGWSTLNKQVQLYNRLQCFIRFHKEIENKKNTTLSTLITPGRQRTWGNFRWTTVEEAVKERDKARVYVMQAVFTPEVNALLETALSLYQSGKSLSDNYFKQHTDEKGTADSADVHEQTTNILDTLVEIQKKLEQHGEAVQKPWREKIKTWSTGLEQEVKLIEDIKEVGFTASTALATEHAKSIHENERSACERYFRQWESKQNTIYVLGKELQELEESGQTDGMTETEKEVHEQRLQDCSIKLLLLQKEAAEMDLHVKELYDVCHLYFPESAAEVEELPSTCAWCVDSSIRVPRWSRYERERPLSCYSQMELENKSSIDPLCLPSGEEIMTFDLLKATYTNPLDNSVHPCWLKRYTLPPLTDLASTLEGSSLSESYNLEHLKGEQLQALVRVMRRELAVSDACLSSLVLSPTDVFCDQTLRAVFFHIPRHPTQHRFKSVHDIQKRIEMKGIQWLHDALQSVTDLHYCNAAHGDIRLSAFTYDDFGNTQLGFFSRTDGNFSLDWNVPRKLKEAQKKDVADFGALLLSEVIPYLSRVSREGAAGVLDRMVDDAEITTEVAERLLGRTEPSWSLVEARNFVRRYVELEKEESVNPREVEESETAVTYPHSWALRYGSVPIIVSTAHQMQLDHAADPCCLLLNRNIPLWGSYCKAKRALASTARVFTQPSSFRQVVGLIPSSDDSEMNERFLYYPCQGEEEAWSLCMGGFPSTPAVITLHTTMSNIGNTVYGLVCRVAVGTVVENVGEEDAKQRSVYCEETGEVHVPAWRCYPEYLCQRLL